MPGYISKKQLHPVSRYTCLVFWFASDGSPTNAEHFIHSHRKAKYAIPNKKLLEHPKVFEQVSNGGELGTRTPDPLRVMQVL